MQVQVLLKIQRAKIAAKNTFKKLTITARNRVVAKQSRCEGVYNRTGDLSVTCFGKEERRREWGMDFSIKKAVTNDTKSVTKWCRRWDLTASLRFAVNGNDLCSPFGEGVQVPSFLLQTNKNSKQFLLLAIFGAEDGTWTHTNSHSQASDTWASAYSATSANIFKASFDARI